MNPIELGKFIANLRNKKHLTQEDLADKLFIDKRKISRWECGTSIPEFEMLIKLSEILDVSLYELSICKHIESDKISRKILNKFNSIKDIKKYNLKKKILYFFIILLLVFFTFTTIYTFKYYGTIEIYELKSLDENFTIVGNYIKIKNNHILNITKIDFDINNNENTINKNNCNYEIYDNKKRLFQFIDYNNNKDNSFISNYHDKNEKEYDTKMNFSIKIHCEIDKKEVDYSFKINSIKIYDNRLF